MSTYYFGNHPLMDVTINYSRKVLNYLYFSTNVCFSMKNFLLVRKKTLPLQNNQRLNHLTLSLGEILLRKCITQKEGG